MGKFPEIPEPMPSGGGGPLAMGFSGSTMSFSVTFGGCRQFKVGVGKFSDINGGEFVEIEVGKKVVGVAEFFPESGKPREVGMGVGIGLDSDEGEGAFKKHGIPVSGKPVSGASFAFWGFSVGSKPVSKTTSPLPIIQNTTSQGGIDGKGSLALCP